MNELHPIGIMPESIWKHKRFIELGEAITRYIDAGLPYPPEWTEEYNRLYKEIDEIIRK